MEVMCEYSAIQLRGLSIRGFEDLGGIQSQLPVLNLPSGWCMTAPRLHATQIPVSQNHAGLSH